jgi:ElaB/YqjD/DUF883 family membrane-anchored ribosome-binding protein
MASNFEGNTSVDSGRVTNGANEGQFQEFFDGVDDLIARIAQVQSPEIQKIRAKARVALGAARSAVKDSAAHVSKQARQLASTTDGYVRSSPWQAVAVGTLLGLVVGFAAGRTSVRD